jgi:integrase/recombinase XerD
MRHVLFPYPAMKNGSSRGICELRQFKQWLVSDGHSECSVRTHIRMLYRVLTESRSILSHNMISGRVLHRAFELTVSRRLSGPLRATESVYARFLKAEGRLVEVTTKGCRFDRVLGPYHDYLIHVRGLSESTVSRHDSTVSEFLCQSLRGTQSLKTLAGRHVERYLEKKSAKITRHSLKNEVSRLRAFLRYAYAKELILQRLDFIDSPRTYRDELPPRALPWPLVKKLLRSVDRSSKSGWRDVMILHLMAHYGLRPSEVAALRIDSINWDARTCRVEQRKTRTDLVLPLLDSTISMVRRYLRRHRPQGICPQLFLRAISPMRALQRTGVSDVFCTRAAQSGLPLDGYCAYSLRHSFAMRLLQRGVGVKAIGDLLGHRSLEATCVYLRLNIAALRTVALPVPHVRRTSVAHHAR